MGADEDARMAHARRWLRPDWQRWIRPDWERCMQPDAVEAMRHEIALRCKAFEPPPCTRERLRKERATQERERREQDALDREVLLLRRDLTESMLEYELRRFQQKYSPDQPRVPAGNPDGGEWTRVAANGRLPPTLGHNSGNVDIPPERPEDSRARTAVVRAAARILARIPHPVARAAALLAMFESAPWLRERQAEIETQLDPPKSLEELQRDVDEERAGTQKHHIVEQGAARGEGFPDSMINDSDNLVRIPKQKHQEISEWYSRKNDAFDDMTPRDWLRGKSWEDRRALGIKKLIDFGVLKP
jgi:hypothetical protein